MCVLYFHRRLPVYVHHIIHLMYNKMKPPTNDQHPVIPIYTFTAYHHTRFKSSLRSVSFFCFDKHLNIKKNVFQVHCLRQRRLNPEVNILFMRRTLIVCVCVSNMSNTPNNSWFYALRDTGYGSYRLRIKKIQYCKCIYIWVYYVLHFTICLFYIMSCF